MGPFDNFTNPFSGGSVGPGGFDPLGLTSGTGAVGGEFGPTGQLLADPLDLAGVRAKDTASEIARLNALAADEAIGFQRGQIGQVTELFDPFVQAGERPLADLVSAITGEGDFQFQPSERFQTDLERGTRATRRGAAARGLLDSSGTEARLSDLVNALTGREVQSQISNRLQPIQVAQDASRTIGSAEAAGAGAGSSIFSNLASQNLLNAQNLGQARSSSFQSAAGSLQGLANLLATQ